MFLGNRLYFHEVVTGSPKIFLIQCKNRAQNLNDEQLGDNKQSTNLRSSNPVNDGRKFYLGEMATPEIPVEATFVRSEVCGGKDQPSSGDPSAARRHACQLMVCATRRGKRGEDSH